MSFVKIKLLRKAIRTTKNKGCFLWHPLFHGSIIYFCVEIISSSSAINSGLLTTV